VRLRKRESKSKKLEFKRRNVIITAFE